jgi:hypothetical protein
VIVLWNKFLATVETPKEVYTISYWYELLCVVLCDGNAAALNPYTKGNVSWLYIFADPIISVY